MSRELARRIEEIRNTRNVGMLEAKRLALLESAELAAENSLTELKMLTRRDTAYWIDELIKARIITERDDG